ncbi:MAG: CPBP family glutamic-type intramembrane protease [Candidatus Lokiarchaeota archaeon]|nr:CPBP family glutamic-type intramembrane protease [Candidatus Lokiarchaeota archaeon]
MNDNNSDSNSIKLGWDFCPFCGEKLPILKELRFCTSCGLDLVYLKEHKQLPPKFLDKITEIKPFPYPDQMRMYDLDKISDEDILNTKEKTLWSSLSSIGIPIASIFIMNIIAVVLMIFFLFFSPSIEEFMNNLTNPYFLIITSFAELILIILPLIVVKKYLRNPSTKNRFALLGFTTKGVNFWKESIIGIIFSIIGILLVFLVSVFMEIFLELIYGVEIIRDITSAGSEIDVYFFTSDLLSLILLMITMILIVGTTEEILFRGFMQKGLVRRLGVKWGIFITAIIFTFIHLITIFLLYPIFSLSFVVSFFLSFVPYIAISLLLGMLYHWRKENLIAVMITHGFYDALTILIVFFAYNMVF